MMNINKKQQDIIVLQPQQAFIKHAYVGQINDPGGAFAKRAKYYLLFVYVEHEDRLQIFLMKFANNLDNFSVT